MTWSTTQPSKVLGMRKTHGMVCQWIAQRRNSRELAKEEATSLALLATELAAVDTVESPHVDLSGSTAAPSVCAKNFTLT